MVKIGEKMRKKNKGGGGQRQRKRGREREREGEGEGEREKERDSSNTLLYVLFSVLMVLPPKDTTERSQTLVHHRHRKE